MKKVLVVAGLFCLLIAIAAIFLVGSAGADEVETCPTPEGFQGYLAPAAGRWGYGEDQGGGVCLVVGAVDGVVNVWPPHLTVRWDSKELIQEPGDTRFPGNFLWGNPFPHEDPHKMAMVTAILVQGGNPEDLWISKSGLIRTLCGMGQGVWLNTPTAYVLTSGNGVWVSVKGTETAYYITRDGCDTLPIYAPRVVPEPQPVEILLSDLEDPEPYENMARDLQAAGWSPEAVEYFASGSAKYTVMPAAVCLAGGTPPDHQEVVVSGLPPEAVASCR
ncbi:MAG: hypothetical protein HY482_01685 [Candidatus Wildermuthbacteria bacterium]|nr:hypothetical protein [Candidatus Wildermuthbacteria bacterium]